MRAAQAAAAAKQEERPLGAVESGAKGWCDRRWADEIAAKRRAAAKEGRGVRFACPAQGTGGSRQHYRIVPWLERDAEAL